MGPSFESWGSLTQKLQSRFFRSLIGQNCKICLWLNQAVAVEWNYQHWLILTQFYFLVLEGSLVITENVASWYMRKKVGFLRNKMRISTGKQLRIAAVSGYLCFLLKIVQCLPTVFRGSCLFLAWNSRPFSFHPLAAVQPPLSWLPTPFCSPLRTSLSHWSFWCTLCSHSPLPSHPVLSSSAANSYSCLIHPLVLLLSQAFFDFYRSSKCTLGMRP